MLCPRCGTAYGPGITRCPECNVELVEESGTSKSGEPEWVDLVTVLETADPSLLMVAKSLLDVEHVPSFVEGEGIYEGLGAGRIAEADIPMGPGKLLVHPEDVEAARGLLASLQPLKETEEPGA
jgi:hypothetical protein